MTESGRILDLNTLPPATQVETLLRGVLLSRLHDNLVRLDQIRLTELLSNPVKRRTIQPVAGQDANRPIIRPIKANRVRTAVVEDPYGQASTAGPVSRAGDAQTLNTAEGGLRTSRGPQYSLDNPLQPSQMGEGTAHPICKCGMGYQGVPHPCMRWHHKMMTPEAMKDFTEVVKKHAGGYIPEPTLSLDLLSPDTQAYIAQVVNPKPQGENDRPVLVAFMPNVMKKLLKVFRDDEGNRLVLTLNPHPSPYGVTDLVLTISEDPEWVKAFAKKHEEKHYTMPICCATPDPRIAKSGRSYCHSCKKYLDKVPPPQEQTITITRPVATRPKQEVQK